MTNWPSQNDHAALISMFGNPDANGDGAPDPAWFSAHMTTIVPPYQMYYGPTPISRITCNRAIALPLHDSLQGVLTLCGSQAEVQKHGLHLFGGVYNFRPKRKGGSLSMHSYGAAIDLDPAHNPQKPTGGTMPAEVVAVFKKHGAIWGGDWTPKYRDPMHFQWATV